MRARPPVPFIIIVVVFVAVIVAGALFYYSRPAPKGTTANGRPGAEPPHIRGSPRAPVALEEFGDFECLPCFMLWPALRNLEHDYGDRLQVVFREHPLPQQHKHALDGARAAEAAGMQGKFWEMHDMLYTERRDWVRAANPRESLSRFAAQLGLDVAKFARDIDGAEVTKRLAADESRGQSLRIDRTPVVFVNGRRVQLQGDVENGLRADIDAALGHRGSAH